MPTLAWSSVLAHGGAPFATRRFVQDAEGSTFGMPAGSIVPSNKTTNKLNPTRQRGVVNRPIATSIGRAQEEFKLFVTHPEEIDHNLYGRFLGILKGAPEPSPSQPPPPHARGSSALTHAAVQTRAFPGRPSGSQSPGRTRCTR